MERCAALRERVAAQYQMLMATQEHLILVRERLAVLAQYHQQPLDQPT
jgi:hypothetical protein